LIWLASENGNFDLSVNASEFETEHPSKRVSWVADEKPSRTESHPCESGALNFLSEARSAL
jgi:hypothetical protein